MPSNSQAKGFGLIGVLVVIVVLAIIGGTGVLVYHRDHKGKTQVSDSTNASARNGAGTSNKSATTTNPYSGWSTETLGSTGLSFKYPSTWTVQDITECDGAHNYTVDSPSSEVQQSGMSGVSHYGLAVTVNAKVSKTSNCAPSASSLAGVMLSSQSQSHVVGSGVLKGKYVITDGNSDGVSGTALLNDTYSPGQKIAEAGLLSVNGVTLQITSALASGQNPASASTADFVSSHLYKDTLNILNSFSTAN